MNVAALYEQQDQTVVAVNVTVTGKVIGSLHRFFPRDTSFSTGKIRNHAW